MVRMLVMIQLMLGMWIVPEFAAVLGTSCTSFPSIFRRSTGEVGSRLCVSRVFVSRSVTIMSERWVWYEAQGVSCLEEAFVSQTMDLLRS